MIYDKLCNVRHYLGLSAEMDQALQFIASNDLNTFAPGSHEIGNGIYFDVVNDKTKLRDACRWEAHQKYTDIQILLEGTDRMGSQPVCDLEIETAYVPDIAFYRDNGRGLFVDVRPGYFTVFFPWDAHMPLISQGDPASVKKIIFKVPVE
ncbi:YhcH/YjgK/YiaL family protein [Anaerotruncus rubiinfantis]|uniref:YhcH/YjgK/YiaL family protein n=1 Tax=Anaerotruncus rubiinfantis TaxID=1720200 RepID=UPI0034A40C56